MKNDDTEKIERFYKENNFKGILLQKIKKSASNSSEMALERRASFKIKKRDQPQFESIKPQESDVLTKIEPEKRKRVKEDIISMVQTELPSFVLPKNNLQKIETSELIFQKSDEKTKEVVNSDENYKRLVFGAMSGLTLDRLLNAQSRFYVSTEEAKNFLKKSF